MPDFDVWQMALCSGIRLFGQICICDESVSEPDSMGNVWCAVKKTKFRQIWDKWTLVVGPPRLKLPGLFGDEEAEARGRFFVQ